mgnify:CR=1 FL=1
MSHPVVVIGAGLSGLYASWLLQQSGQRVLLLEARDRIGGRVLSQGADGTAHRLDLGPAWFWPGMNPRVQKLLKALNLRSFPQHTRGATMVEGQDGKVYKQQSGWGQSSSSYRIAGGTGALTQAIYDQFSAQVNFKANTHVLGMQLRPHAVELDLQDSTGPWRQGASQVIVTIPPRVMAQDLALVPAWPETMMKDMRATPTWMAGQAKFVAAYASAFWREAGLSGDAMSHRGPMSEIHDASDESGQSAGLFGFVGASPSYRAGIGREAMQSQSLAQLERLFGPQAATPLWSAVQDWALDPFTATPEDSRPLSYHPMYAVGEVPNEWRSRVALAGTERSRNYGGFLEGALEAAELAVESVLGNLRTQAKLSLSATETE